MMLLIPVVSWVVARAIEFEAAGTELSLPWRLTLAATNWYVRLLPFIAIGGVGFAAIQLAKRAGATVIGTASSDERLERLKDYGLDYGINYRNEDFVARARALSGGQGVHLAVDGVGGKTLEGSINATGYRGRISRYGNVGRDFDPPDTSALGGMNRSLTGYSMAIETFRDPPRVRAMVEGHLRDVANGSLKVVIDRTFPLAEAAAAHGYIENQHAFGRVVLLP